MIRHVRRLARWSAVCTALALLAFAPAAPLAAAAPEIALGCGYADTTQALLNQMTLDSWMGWVRRLSGADPVIVSGQARTITTRYSPALFNGTSPAYNYLYETLTAPGWYTPAQIEEDSYQPYSDSSETWKNLILTIEGSQYPDEVVILSAHFDSTSHEPTTDAPGAEDNATGSAALLEAARVLRGVSLPRTLKLIWFTGEEQYMLGSKAYLSDPLHPERRSGVEGVINLDMYGYDADDDGCFELHISSNPSAAHAAQSQRVAACFVTAMHVYNIDLRYDYLTSGATSSSDHSSFWAQGIGAVEVLENYFTNTQPNGCTGRDSNPYYHTPNDRVEYLNPQSGFDITRAGLAAAFSLANPVPVYRNYFPLVKN